MLRADERERVEVAQVLNAWMSPLFVKLIRRFLSKAQKNVELI
jgi:hypothetical protein